MAKGSLPESHDIAARKLLLLVCLAASLLNPGAGRGEQETLEDVAQLNKKSTELAAEGNFAEAETLARRILAI